MKKVTMIECDSPTCGKIGDPENDKPLRPPYGWLQMKGGYYGSGPYGDVTVCSIDCLVDALNDKLVDP